MKTYLRRTFFWLFFPFLVNCGCSKPNLSSLKKDIEALLLETQGDFAVAFKDLTTNEEILIRADESFHAASTMKTPVMMEVFKQASLGKFSLYDTIIIKNEFKSIVDGSEYSLTPEEDSEVDLYNQPGTYKTIYDLMYDMIVVSSNLATNIIIELVDPKMITQSMHELGAKNILVLRGVEDLKAYELGLNNTTTAKDLMLIYESLATESFASKEDTNKMISILSNQKFNDIIPARLPENLKIAHKTGSITGVQHDSGIIFLPDNRMYVLVLLSRNVLDMDAARDMMATVSELIYKYQEGL